MRYYLNFDSDYDGQLKIGVERLEQASLPVEYNPSTGMCHHLAKICFEEKKETGIGYYRKIFNPNEPFYISKRNLHSVPTYKIPKEYQND